MCQSEIVDYPFELVQMSLSVCVVVGLDQVIATVAKKRVSMGYVIVLYFSIWLFAISLPTPCSEGRAGRARKIGT